MISVEMKLSYIDEIVRLSKLPIKQLRKMNKEDNYPCYNGTGLKRNQLIYQLVFKRDAPDNEI